MLLFVLFTLLAAFASAKYQHGICEKQLASAVYGVHTPQRAYLEKISREIKNVAQLPTEHERANLLENFTQKYKVAVLVIDAFGDVKTYVNGKSLPIYDYDLANRPPYYSSRDATAVLNLGAYALDETYGVPMYNFLSFSTDARVLEIQIANENNNFY